MYAMAQADAQQMQQYAHHPQLQQLQQLPPGQQPQMYQPIPPPKPSQYEPLPQHQQQQVYQQQPLHHLQPGIPPGNILYHQQQIQNQYSVRSPPNMNQVMAAQQMHPVHAQNIYSQNGAASIMSGAATLRRPPTNNIITRDPMESIPNSNLIDSAMFERDKQIYKCSTLRQGGKFDPRNFGPRPAMQMTVNGQHPPTSVVQQPKPSILNCPLPEIPKEYGNNNAADPNNTTSPRNFNTNGNPNMPQPTMTR